MVRPLLVIVGPSGAGKSALVRQLVQLGDIELLPTWTTRPRRSDEHGEDVDHVFVDDVALDRAVQQKLIIDTMPLFGLPYRYGLPTLNVHQEGPITTLMARAFLLDRLRSHETNVVVYHLEAPAGVAHQRLMERSRESVELGDRLELFAREVELGRAEAQRIFRNVGSLRHLVQAVRAALLVDFSQGGELCTSSSSL